jgi:hypothetical protein
LQEIYGIDIPLFSCRYSKSTGHQAIGFSLRTFQGDTVFNWVPDSRSFLAKGGRTADKSFLDLI